MYQAKKIKRTALLLAGLMATLLIHTGKVAAHEERLPWSVGHIWHVDTTLYSRDWAIDFSDPSVEANKHVPRVLAKYDVTIQVSGEELLKGREYWTVDFLVGNGAPEGVREQSYRVWVSKKNGSMHRLERLSGREIGAPMVERTGESGFLVEAPYGIPLEIIPRIGDGRLRKESRQGKVSVYSARKSEEAVSGGSRTELSVYQKSEEISLVIQTWKTGATWWTEYEKFNRGHKELHARLR